MAALSALQRDPGNLLVSGGLLELQALWSYLQALAFTVHTGSCCTLICQAFTCFPSAKHNACIAALAWLANAFFTIFAFAAVLTGVTSHLQGKPLALCGEKMQAAKIPPAFTGSPAQQ